MLYSTSSWQVKTSLFFAKLLMIASMFCASTPAKADYEWMTTLLSNLAVFFAERIEVPTFNYNNTGSKSLVINSGWQSTGAQVKNGKTLKLEWSSDAVSIPTRKYYVMYRIDPRFSRPQVFILKGVTTNNGYTTYTSDISTINNGLPMGRDLQATFQKYDNYFNYSSSSPDPRIVINTTSVVTMHLVSANEFFSAGGVVNFGSELNHQIKDPFAIYTETGVTDNNMIYMRSEEWCTKLFGGTVPNSYTCINVNGKALYANDGDFEDRLWGIADTTSWMGKLDICGDAATGKQPCLYDKGRGMKITIGGSSVKDTHNPFVHSDFTGQNFFYYDASVGMNTGVLDFITDWDMQPQSSMFQSFNPLIKQWPYTNKTSWRAAFMGSDLAKAGALSPYLHIGRYIIYIEIGDRSNAIIPSVEYIISDGPPSAQDVGTVVTRSFAGQANKAGTLWLRALTSDNTNAQGSIAVSYSNYTGSTLISDSVSNYIMTPILEMLTSSTKALYRNIASNSRLREYAFILIQLYIVFYALYFLAGAVNIKAYDVVVRIVKISIVVTLFSTNSWEVFNNYFFNGFVGGSTYLINSIVGATSGSNIFGFLDLIFDKYMNPTMWGLIAIELLSPFNGVTFFAIITIYSILIYLIAVLQVVIGYLMAFISMAVLISLGPIFITLLLFERTKSMCNNWVSAIFNCMLQPTILLMFFLLIDQIMLDQLSHIVLPACWDILIPLAITIDLTPLGIPLTFPSLEIPGLAGIPFFMSSPGSSTGLQGDGGSYLNFVSSVIIFHCYAVMASGLTTYVQALVSSLTSIGSSSDISGSNVASQMSSSISHTISAPVRIAADEIQTNNLKKKQERLAEGKPRDEGGARTNKASSQEK